MSGGLKQSIVELATSLKFSACGFSSVGPVPNELNDRYKRWITQGKNGCMQWAANHMDLRADPTLLLPGAKTVIALALNYYPRQFQPLEAPQFAYYAYGEDYHKVLRRKMKAIAQYILSETGEKSRVCVDSAPIHERYLAQRAGIGFVGLNNSLIIPGKGSYFFLGIMLTTLEIEPDEPCTESCVQCRACIRQCPAGALREGEPVDARRCLSCLTIENRGPMPPWVSGVIGNRIYGCDACQQCCPHNNHVVATEVDEFKPSEQFLGITDESLVSMTAEEFEEIFGRSAVKRTGLQNLRRNLAAIREGKSQ